MKTNIIFYKTTADFDNTGEVLIYKSLLELLREQGSVLVDDSSKTSPLFLKRIGLTDDEKLSAHTRFTFIPALYLYALKYLFTRHRVFFITGVGEHCIKGWKATVKNLFSFLFLLSLRGLKVKLVRIGMSIRFNGKKEALSERLLSGVFHHYYVRDSLSLSFCQKAGIHKCKLAPDLSWAFHPTVRAAQEKRYIIFSFRDFCTSETDNITYARQLTKTLKYVITYLQTHYPHYEILLTWQANKDKGYMEKIRNEIPVLKLLPELISLDNAHEYYGKSIAVFSNRLHVLLLAYKYDALTICITDTQAHVKIKGIFEDNQLKNRLLDINVAPETTVRLIDALLKNSGQENLCIRKTEEKNRKELKNIITKIFS